MCSPSHNATSSRICFDIVEKLLWKSVSKAFVAEKILTAREDIFRHVCTQLKELTYQDLLSRRWIGLIYPKWMVSKELPLLDLMVDASLLNVPQVIEIYHTHFRSMYRKIVYEWTIQSCIKMAINFGNVKVLEYIFSENKVKRENFEYAYDVFVYSTEDVIDFVYRKLGIAPTPDAFYNMMCLNTNVNFVPYIPEDIPVKVVMIAYGMFHDREENHAKEDDAMRDLLGLISNGPSITLTKDERIICQRYCEIPMWQYVDEEENQQEEDDDIDVIEHFPIWKVLRYLWEWFRTYPPTYDLETCFAEIVENKDLEGLAFLVEDLGYIPRDPYQFYDELLKEKEMARFVMDNIAREGDGWDEFEEMYEEMYDDD